MLTMTRPPRVAIRAAESRVVHLSSITPSLFHPRRGAEISGPPTAERWLSREFADNWPSIHFSY